MAVENDYNLLVHNLNELAATVSSLRDEVERRRLREAEERRQPNETDWVNVIGVELGLVDPLITGLRAGVRDVLVRGGRAARRSTKITEDGGRYAGNAGRAVGA